MCRRNETENSDRCVRLRVCVCLLVAGNEEMNEAAALPSNLQFKALINWKNCYCGSFELIKWMQTSEAYACMHACVCAQAVNQALAVCFTFWFISTLTFVWHRR